MDAVMAITAFIAAANTTAWRKSRILVKKKRWFVHGMFPDGFI